MKSKEKRRAIRRHFIKEWMEDREMTPADIVDALDIDKSQVYRWLKGQLPQPDMQERARIKQAMELAWPPRRS
jgi:predicted XRE-type DNA-binding protein